MCASSRAAWVNPNASARLDGGHVHTKPVSPSFFRHLDLLDMPFGRFFEVNMHTFYTHSEDPCIYLKMEVPKPM